LGTTLLCAIYGAIVENTLFEDGDAANIFCAFNPTQVFLHLKKNCYYPTMERGQYASYYIIMEWLFLKIFFKNIYWDNIFFKKIGFLYYHIKIIKKYQKNINLN